MKRATKSQRRSKRTAERRSLDGVVGLRRQWEARAQDYRTGRTWTYYDDQSVRLRQVKAEAIEICARDLAYELRRVKRANAPHERRRERNV